MLRVAYIAVPLLLAGVAGAQTPGFWLVGAPPGGTASGVTGLSSNGELAVGGSFIPTPMERAPGFTWSAGTGRIDFGLYPGMPQRSGAYGVDSEGQIVVGVASLGTGPSPLYFDRAYRWTGSGPLQNLGLLPGEERSYAWGTSGDGAVVVGHAEHSPFTNAYGQAFRWTESGGMQGLGFARPGGSFSQAYGISRDGSTIVGLSQSGGTFGDVEAFRWTAAGGMEVLPNLPGAPYTWYEARAVNADGSVIVGYAPAAVGGVQHAVRWTASGIQDLGVAPGTVDSFARCVSDDGTVVGGFADVPNGTGAIVWTPSTGMALLSDFLSAHGVTLPPGYTLDDIRAVSGDGLTFAGIASFGSLKQGYVATIPSPAAALVLASVLVASHRRR